MKSLVLLVAALLAAGLVGGCQPKEQPGEMATDWQKVPRPDNYGPPSHAAGAERRPAEAPR